MFRGHHLSFLVRIYVALTRCSLKSDHVYTYLYQLALPTVAGVQGEAVLTRTVYWARQYKLGLCTGRGSTNQDRVLGEGGQTRTMYWARQCKLGPCTGRGNTNQDCVLGEAVQTRTVYWARQDKLGPCTGRGSTNQDRVLGEAIQTKTVYQARQYTTNQERKGWFSSDSSVQKKVRGMYLWVNNNQFSYPTQFLLSANLKIMINKFFFRNIDFKNLFLWENWNLFCQDSKSN